MASRAFRNRFRNTCCSLPGLPLTGLEIGSQIQPHLNARLLQLMLQQRKRFLNHAVQLNF